VARPVVLRQLLEDALEAAVVAGSARPADRGVELVGRYRIEPPDLGSRHREHLRDLLEDRRG
jgi:hypothetical protein